LLAHYADVFELAGIPMTGFVVVREILVRISQIQAEKGVCNTQEAARVHHDRSDQKMATELIRIGAY
jgi:hypothetical protein